ISCITKFNRQLLTHRFAAIVDFGATNIIGEALDCKSTNVTTDSSTIVLDQTTNNLRKAIVGDLIKNPKVFKGDKDNVKREELFQLSNINIDNNTNNNHQPAKTEHFSSLTTTPSSTNRYPANNFSNKYPSGYARNFSYNPNTFNNRNIRS
ncbi:unnamed protein product, partial [Rotaria sp. Silwood2]